MDNRNEEDPASYSRAESKAERLDRNYEELLQELRVAQIGVQILFAFLLGIAFQQRFAEITAYQRTIYVITLVCTALAVGLLITPVVLHRALFGRRRKDELVNMTSKLQIWGIAAMLVSLIGSVLLVVDFILGLGTALTIVGVLAAVLIYLWLVLPLVTKRKHDRDG